MSTPLKAWNSATEKLTSQKSGDLVQIRMLIAHMAELDDADMLRRVDASLLLPFAFRCLVRDGFGVGVGDGCAAVRRRPS